MGLPNKKSRLMKDRATNILKFRTLYYSNNININKLTIVYVFVIYDSEWNICKQNIDKLKTLFSHNYLYLHDDIQMVILSYFVSFNRSY